MRVNLNTVITAVVKETPVISLESPGKPILKGKVKGKSCTLGPRAAPSSTPAPPTPGEQPAAAEPTASTRRPSTQSGAPGPRASEPRRPHPRSLSAQSGRPPWLPEQGTEARNHWIPDPAEMVQRASGGSLTYSGTPQGKQPVEPAMKGLIVLGLCLVYTVALFTVVALAKTLLALVYRPQIKMTIGWKREDLATPMGSITTSMGVTRLKTGVTAPVRVTKRRG